MDEVVRTLSASILQISLAFLLVRRDERRLSATELARAFPQSTFYIAVVVFGALAIPVHFVRTRRSIRGIVLGLVWLAVTVALSAAVASAFGAIFGTFSE